MQSMRWDRNLIVEGVLRLVLFIVFRITDDAEPFHRKIQPEELWLYKNPRTDSYVPVSLLWFTVYVTPSAAVGAVYLFKRNLTDAVQATLGVTLSIWLCGIITNCVKLGVGRPRPDFFWRCYPDGIYEEDRECTGDVDAVREGYKSFPSGHSALSFSSLAFVSLYLAGKLHCFTGRGRGHTWRLCLCVAPLLLGLMIAVSRTADYHHHWQDVTVGSVLGLSIAYLCYRQFYPALNKSNSHLAYVEITPLLPVTSPDIGRPQLSPPVVSHNLTFSGLK